jgi:hypothetical protein
VLQILTRDDELRPLIFEHEQILMALKDIREIRAEQMLSILTAAETEMYENSKGNDNPKPTEHVEIQCNLAQEPGSLCNFPEHSEFNDIRRNLEKELSEFQFNKKQMEKENECTFKNLTDEIKQLRQINDTLKKQDSEKDVELEHYKEALEEMQTLKR